MKQMSLNCLGHIKAVPFFFKFQTLPICSNFFSVKQDEPDTCPSGTVFLCARVLFKYGK